MKLAANALLEKVVEDKTGCLLLSYGGSFGFGLDHPHSLMHVATNKGERPLTETERVDIVWEARRRQEEYEAQKEVVDMCPKQIEATITEGPLANKTVLLCGLEALAQTAELAE